MIQIIVSQSLQVNKVNHQNINRFTKLAISLQTSIPLTTRQKINSKPKNMFLTSHRKLHKIKLLI